MQHPFYRNRKLFIIYTSIWILISIIQMLVLVKQYGLNTTEAVSDSLFYNASLAIIGTSVWYLARFVTSSKPGYFYIIVNHATAATIIILVWIFIFKNLLESIFGNSELYIKFSSDSAVWRVSFGYMIYGILVLIYFAEQNYSELQEKILNETILKSKAKETELKLLKAQINPHFLFNSLNSIGSLIHTNPEKAHEMLINLSDYFRYSISKNGNQFTTLKSEIENCKKYLEIEQIRFGSKLKVSFITEPLALNCQVPVMILQPLYENAVKYGVYESLKEVYILTKIKIDANFIEIIIENDSENALKTKKGEGVGLQNVKDRLKLSYNTENLLNIKQEPGKFTVLVKIPCQNI